MKKIFIKIIVYFYLFFCGILCAFANESSFSRLPDLLVEDVVVKANNFLEKKYDGFDGYKITGVTYSNKTESWLIIYSSNLLVIGGGSGFGVSISDSKPNLIYIMPGL